MTTRRWRPSARADRGHAPELGALDSRHLVRWVNVQDVTASTGFGRPVPPYLYDLTSADGMASLIATVLAVSERPATPLLEELAHTEIRIEVLSSTDRELTASEHHRLDASPITSAHRRAELLRTKDGIVAAETELIILPQRLPAGARAPWPTRASRTARSWRSSARGGWTAAPCVAGAVRILLARTWRLSPWQCWRSAIPRSASLPKGSLGRSADLLRSVVRYEPPFYHFRQLTRAVLARSTVEDGRRLSLLPLVTGAAASPQAASRDSLSSA